MKLLPKIVFVAAACALLVATFSVIGPRAVHAVFATLVRDVDNAARHRFQGVCDNFSAGTNTSCTLTTPTVPAGEVLVIHGVTLRAITDPGGSVDAHLVTTVNGIEANYFVGMQDMGAIPIGPALAHEYMGIVPFTIYADPGTGVSVTVFRNTGVPPDGIQVIAALSGYFVTLP